MTVSTTASRIGYTGDGTTTSFSFPYYVQLQSDLELAIYDTLLQTITPLVLNTDYTLAGTFTPGFGYLTGLTAAIPGGSTNVPAVIPSTSNLVIYRDPAEVQNLSLPPNTPYPPAPTEAGLDALVLMMQRLQDLLSRSVRMPDGFPLAFDPTLPIGMFGSVTGGCTIVTDPTGAFFQVGPALSQIAQASDDAATAAAAAASAASAQASADAASTSATSAAAAAAASASAASDSETASAASQAAAATSASAAAAASSALYNAVVGAGGTHATLPLALAAASAGWKIYVADSATINTGGGATVSTDNTQIDFGPGVTYTKGTLTGTALDINAVGVRINGARFSGFTTAIQVESGKNFNFVKECRFNLCTTQINDLNSAPNNVYSDNITEA